MAADNGSHVGIDVCGERPGGRGTGRSCGDLVSRRRSSCMHSSEVYLFNFGLGLSAFGIVIAEILLFWPWSGLMIGVLLVGGAAVVLPAVLSRTRDSAIRR